MFSFLELSFGFPVVSVLFPRVFSPCLSFDRLPLLSLLFTSFFWIVVAVLSSSECSCSVSSFGFSAIRGLCCHLPQCIRSSVFATVFPKAALLWSLASPPWFSCLGVVIAPGEVFSHVSLKVYLVKQDFPQ